MYGNGFYKYSISIAYGGRHLARDFRADFLAGCCFCVAPWVLFCAIWCHCFIALHSILLWKKKIIGKICRIFRILYVKIWRDDLLQKKNGNGGIKECSVSWILAKNWWQFDCFFVSMKQWVGNEIRIAYIIWLFVDVRKKGWKIKILLKICSNGMF